MANQSVVGFIETIRIDGKEFSAKIDKVAYVSSIDIGLAADLQLGPIVQKTRITSSHGKTRRAVIPLEFVIVGKKVTAHFNLADRHRLKYKILIGKNILKEGFIIDPLKE